MRQKFDRTIHQRRPVAAAYRGDSNVLSSDAAIHSILVLFDRHPGGAAKSAHRYPLPMAGKVARRFRRPQPGIAAPAREKTDHLASTASMELIVGANL
jgi:hypothetical protein